MFNTLRNNRAGPHAFPEHTESEPTFASDTLWVELARFFSPFTGSSFLADTPASIRLLPHNQFQFSALHQIGMAKPRTRKRLAVQGRLLDISVRLRTARRQNNKPLAARQMDRHLLKDRTADGIEGLSRRDRIKAHA